MNPAQQSLLPYVQYRCVVGSKAYGLNRSSSDTDRRGFYLPPPERDWSLFPPPEQLEDRETDECYWEVGKFVRIALKGNPNLLEAMHSPIVELSTPIAEELLSIRSSFFSQKVHDTYRGYADAQFRKLINGVANHGQPNWKHAMHLLRLLIQGEQLVRTGILVTEVGEHRELLLSVRDGLLTMEQFTMHKERLESLFDASIRRSVLPEEPDYGMADAFLINARRTALAME